MSVLSHAFLAHRQDRQTPTLSALSAGKLGGKTDKDRQTSTKDVCRCRSPHSPKFQTRYAQMSVCISAGGSGEGWGGAPAMWAGREWASAHAHSEGWPKGRLVRRPACAGARL